MKCDRCGNESKYLVRVLSEQDVTDSGMSREVPSREQNLFQ